MIRTASLLTFRGRGEVEESDESGLWVMYGQGLKGNCPYFHLLIILGVFVKVSGKMQTVPLKDIHLIQWIQIFTLHNY